MEQAVPVTVIFRTPVRKEKMDKYIEWFEGITEASRQFTGFEGNVIMKEPSDEADVFLMYTISRWSTLKDAESWRNSPQRAAHLQKRKPFSDMETETAVGTAGIDAQLEFKGKPKVPWYVARRRSFVLFILTWLTVWSHVTFFNFLLPMVAGFASMNFDLQIGITCAAVAAMMHYLTFDRILKLAKQIGLFT